MRMFSGVADVFLYRDFVDFRKSINGLSLIVEQQMVLYPLTGSVELLCGYFVEHTKQKLGISQLKITEEAIAHNRTI
jgi:hypothetical protein